MLAACLIIALAGFVNGSFALFIKHIKGWRFEHVWTGFALSGFLILPWVLGISLSPGHVAPLGEFTPLMQAIVIAGGIAFGVGQVCFAVSINRIGIGLAFLLNIGIGTVLGALIPLVIQHTGQVFSPSGLLVILACLLIAVGLWLSYVAGKRRAHGHATYDAAHAGFYILGVVAACIAGLFSAVQNIVFSLTLPAQLIAQQHGYTPLAASLLVWPEFLFFSFLPYIIYMIYLAYQHRKDGFFARPIRIKYLFYVLLMGVFWYGALALYSEASHLIGSLGPVIGWPLFMAFIILASNFWGAMHGEWKGCHASVIWRLLTGIVLFIVAVVVLGLSSYLK